MKAVSLLLFLIGCSAPFPIGELDSPFGAVLASDTLRSFVGGRPVSVDPFVRVIARGGPDLWGADAPVIDTLKARHLTMLSQGGAALVPNTFSWRVIDADTILMRISRYDLDPQRVDGTITVMVLELVRGHWGAHRFSVSRTDRGWQAKYVDYLMI